MNEEEIKKIINGTYDDSREDNLLSMVGQLYSQKMVPSMIVHGAYSLPFIVGAVFCGIKFFRDHVCRYLCLLYRVLYFQQIQVLANALQNEYQPGNKKTGTSHR
jgi:hypothetical protein